jgi:MFS transporter, MHS family, proline/betaine transporter
MGLVPTLLSELFPTTVRMSALSVAYTLAQRAVRWDPLGVVVAWLVSATDMRSIVVVYCAGAILCTLVGAWIVRETARGPMADS